MNFIILFFSLVTYPVLKYKFDKKENDIYNGRDNRYSINENSIDNDQFVMAKIGKYFLYKELLKTIKNDKVSIQEKLQIIEDSNILHLDKSKYVPNLLTGGLMDDFNFELYSASTLLSSASISKSRSSPASSLVYFSK